MTVSVNGRNTQQHIGLFLWSSKEALSRAPEGQESMCVSLRKAHNTFGDEVKMDGNHGAQVVGVGDGAGALLRLTKSTHLLPLYVLKIVLSNCFNKQLV